MGKQGLAQKPPGQMPPDFSSLLGGFLSGGFCPVPKKIVIQSNLSYVTLQGNIEIGQHKTDLINM